MRPNDGFVVMGRVPGTKSVPEVLLPNLGVIPRNGSDEQSAVHSLLLSHYIRLLASLGLTQMRGSERHQK
jgi:hypothetical protein